MAKHKTPKLKPEPSSKPARLPRLPSLLDRKIYKTGQTRGADDDDIIQNRVGRNSTVLIPDHYWTKSFKFPPEGNFENGYIVLISPENYFGVADIKTSLADQKLELGTNALVFYQLREHWNKYPPKKGWTPAQNRVAPLKGQFVARISATTAATDGGRIVEGFTTTSSKGAGINVYEYASSTTIGQCRLQLEALFWHCVDSESVAEKHGMTKEEILARKSALLSTCAEQGLLDYKNLVSKRMLNLKSKTTCPLCLLELSAEGFFSRMEQAEGREVPDLTVTEINLFHIDEIKIGYYNHCPYNLGWGHHHCNVVTRDNGIAGTLKWMREVIERNP